MTAAALKDEGNALFKKDLYSDAVEKYTESLKLDPTQHLVLSNRSAAYVKLGGAENLEKSLTDANDCVRLAPTFAKGYSRQASSLQAAKRWKDAADAVRTGIEAAPDDSLKKMLKEVLSAEFKDSMIGNWHGQVSEELGGYDQQMEFLENGTVRITVLGRSVDGKYVLNASVTPTQLNIQVPMPDAPMGLPPPPPVEYIVRLQADELHLCCPVQVLKRPTEFKGPGLCVMLRGGLTGEDYANELKGLTEEDKMLKCASEVTASLPNGKLEEPCHSDGEEATRQKLMMQVKFEANMFKVKSKFGEELMHQVLEFAKGNNAPTFFEQSKELVALRKALVVCGFIEEDAKPTSPTTRSAPRPKEEAKGKVDKIASESKSAQGVERHDKGVSGQVVCAAISSVALVAVIVTFVFSGKRRNT